MYIYETKPPFNHHKTNNCIFVSAVIIVQRIIRQGSGAGGQFWQCRKCGQGPGLTTMVLSIWHYYVISDQSHTMVSVSELRRWWLMTMALSISQYHALGPPGPVDCHAHTTVPHCTHAHQQYTGYLSHGYIWSKSCHDHLVCNLNINLIIQIYQIPKTSRVTLT